MALFKKQFSLVFDTEEMYDEAHIRRKTLGIGLGSFDLLLSLVAFETKQLLSAIQLTNGRRALIAACRISKNKSKFSILYAVNMIWQTTFCRKKLQTTKK